MQIIPDPLVVALQLVPYLLTLAALHFIIFRPMLDYLEDRERARTSGREEADALQVRIEEKLADYEARMNRAHAEVVDLRATRRAAALTEADGRIKQARGHADAQVQLAVAAIDAERKDAAAGIQDTARDIAGDIAGRVLGRALQAG